MMFEKKMQFVLLPFEFVVNDALWDEIRCRQRDAGDERAWRQRPSQWQSAACSRGAGFIRIFNIQPTVMLIV